MSMVAVPSPLRVDVTDVTAYILLVPSHLTWVSELLNVSTVQVFAVRGIGQRTDTESPEELTLPTKPARLSVNVVGFAES